MNPPTSPLLLILSLLVLTTTNVYFTTSASDVLSVEPILYHSQGQIYAKDRVKILCTDNAPLTFTTQAQDTGETITTQVTCKPPKRVMNKQLHGYVPFGQYLYRVPIIIAPQGSNSSTAVNRFVATSAQNAVAQSDTAQTVPSTSRSLLALRSNVLQTRDKITRFLAEREYFRRNVSALGFSLQDNTDDNSDTPGGGCGIGLICPTTDDNLNDLKSWSDIAEVAAIEDLVQGLTTISLALVTGNPLVLAFSIIDAGLTLGLDFGGISPDEAIMRNIQIIANQLLDIERTVDQILRQQQAYDIKQNAINADNSNALDFIRQRLNIDERNIRVLSNQTQILQREIQRVVANDDQRFQGLADTLAQFANADRNITSYLTQLDQRESARFKNVYGVMQKIVAAIESNSDAIEAVRTEKVANRLAAYYYHALLRNMTVDAPAPIGPMLPFSSDTGSPPMRFADIQNLRNKDAALAMATVVIQGTFQQSGAYFARETQISIVCDPTYIANFSMTNINVDFIFRSLGPFTPDAPHCFADDVNAWFCNCILRVNSTDIQYSDSVGPPAVLFPRDWSSPGTLLRFDPTSVQEFTHCQPDTLANGGCGRQGGTAYYDVLTDFEDQLQSLCTSNWVNQQVRVVSLDIPRLIDTSVAPASYAAGYYCEPDYYNLTSSNSPGNATMASAVYSLLTQGFSTLFDVRRRAADIRLYGVAGQSTMRQYLGSRFPSTLNAYKSYELEFGALVTRLDAPIPRLLPVYFLSQGTDVFEMDVQINDQDPLTVNLSAFAGTSVPMNDTFGNLTVISDASTLSNIRGISLLDQDFLWVGAETTYVADTRTHSALDGSPLMFVDFQSGHVKYNAPATQRAGCLNYLEYRVSSLDPNLFFGEGMPFNQSIWASLEGGEDFDPRLMDSPSNYLRRVDSQLHKCTTAVDPATMEDRADGSIPAPNFMCQVRDRFRVDTLIPVDSTTLEFQAREFSYIATIDVPAGAFLGTQVVTICPTNLNITITADDATVFADGPSSCQVRYSVCPATASPASPVGCLTTGTTLALGQLLTFAALQGEYFFQAWPSFAALPTASNRCYPQNGGLGVSLLINRTYTFDSGLPHNVEASMKQIVAEAQIQMMTGMNAIVDLIRSINAGYVTAGEVQAPIVNLNTNLSFLLDNPQLDDLTQQFDDGVQEIASTQSALSTLDQALNDTIADERLLEQQQVNITNTINTLLGVLEAQINALQNALNGLGEPTVDGPNFLGGLWDFIKGILGFFAGLFGLGNILSLIITIVVIVLIVCLIFKCLSICKSSGSSSGTITIGQAPPPPPPAYPPQYQPLAQPPPPPRVVYVPQPTRPVETAFQPSATSAPAAAPPPAPQPRPITPPVRPSAPPPYPPPPPPAPTPAQPPVPKPVEVPTTASVAGPATSTQGRHPLEWKDPDEYEFEEEDGLYSYPESFYSVPETQPAKKSKKKSTKSKPGYYSDE